MSRLPSLKPKQVMQVLQRAGFYEDHVRGSHYYYKHTQNSSLLVVVPYHNKDLKRGTLLSIIAQAGMTIDEFISYL
jgi:predicted RNA binding protein YcfA (HicA-like mRNA interferase family)